MINNEVVFNSMTDAQKYLGCKSYVGISLCCNGKRKSAGKINGQPAKWMLYEDYLELQENNL